jgi:alpha-galactosidase/6-phospho-beta-glucosidase family protein
VLPAAGDRHLAEFVPWFLTSAKSCYTWGFCLTPYSYRIKRWRTAPREQQRQLDGKDPITLSGSGEEYVNQMAALIGLTSFRTNVNLPNTGQMGGMPKGALVETNALFSQDRVEPVVSGELPSAVNALIHPHVVNHELVIRAVLEGDKDMAFRAFINDPLTQRLALDDAWALFNRMLKATHFRF